MSLAQNAAAYPEVHVVAGPKGHPDAVEKKRNGRIREDGDGFHDVHINTMEGFWSLLRSWLFWGNS